MLDMFHVALFLSLLILGWFAGAWLSPVLLAADRKPLSLYELSLVPADLHHVAMKLRATFYTVGGLGVDGFSFSAFFFDQRVICIDRTFLHHAPAAVVRFVIAHEIAHHLLGHPELKALAYMTGLRLFPAVRRWLENFEHQANRWAEDQTGLARSIVWSFHVRPAAGGPGYPTEESEV